MTNTDQRTLFRSFSVHGVGDIGDGAETGAWGVQFPSGYVIVEWRLDAYSPHSRMGQVHRSTYGAIEDFLFQLDDAHIHYRDGEVRRAEDVTRRCEDE